MKSGLWLAILFNVAAVAILAVVTFMGGNGVISRNPYASDVQPPSGPIAIELRPDSPAAAASNRTAPGIPLIDARAEPAWRSDRTPDATPVPWIELPDGTVRMPP
ncbi:MAG: hypothetical protein IPM01_01620 [Burkholderiaceae bacterium]|nr:hypothetical protein [Burkholderiaceae bacterium]